MAPMDHPWMPGRHGRQWRPWLGFSGKRSGVRVVYYYQRSDRPLYLLMVYAKARQETLSPEQKRVVRELAAVLKG